MGTPVTTRFTNPDPSEPLSTPVAFRSLLAIAVTLSAVISPFRMLTFSSSDVLCALDTAVSTAALATAAGHWASSKLGTRPRRGERRAQPRRAERARRHAGTR